MSALTQSPAWKALVRHHESMKDVHVRSLFESDPKRFDKLSFREADLLVDFSKHRVTEETITLLLALAEQAARAAHAHHDITRAPGGPWILARGQWRKRTRDTAPESRDAARCSRCAAACGRLDGAAEGPA